MPTSFDPAELTPDERARQLAIVLATALLRLAQPAVSAETTPHPAPENSPKSLANQLAVSGTKSVTVHAG
jgi:hypothetical protein